MDRSILEMVNGWAAVPWVATLGVILSSRWMLVAVGLPMTIVLGRRRRFVAIASIALCMGLSDLVVARVFKPLIGRQRPCRVVEDLNVVVPCGVGKSFPSGHATTSFAFLWSAAPTVRFGWWIFAPIATGVAGSRILLGVHYPTDVVAGVLLGSLLGFGASRIRRRWEQRDPGRVQKTSS